MIKKKRRKGGKNGGKWEKGRKERGKKEGKRSGLA